jgi:hypothetical protein
MLQLALMVIAAVALHLLLGWPLRYRYHRGGPHPTRTYQAFC